MKRNWLLLLIWPLAAAAFAADDTAVVRTFHVRVPPPGSQVSLGAALLPHGASGIAVAAVVPNGPADRAGIAAGDVLLSINGTALDDAAAEPRDPPAASMLHLGIVTSGTPNVAFGAIAAGPAPNTLAYAGHPAGPSSAAR